MILIAQVSLIWYSESNSHHTIDAIRVEDIEIQWAIEWATESHNRIGMDFSNL